MKKPKLKLPKYAWIGEKGKCAMRLIERSDSYFHNDYWRDAGAWGVQAKEKDGKLITCGHTGDLKYLNGKDIIPCTRAAWKESNGEYV
jgi:hypothetical protein